MKNGITKLSGCLSMQCDNICTLVNLLNSNNTLAVKAYPICNTGLSTYYITGNLGMDIQPKPVNINLWNRQVIQALPLQTIRTLDIAVKLTEDLNKAMLSHCSM